MRGEPPLLVDLVTLSSLLYGILLFGPLYLFRQATSVLSIRRDLRRGLEPRLPPLGHPNGIPPHRRRQITEEHRRSRRSRTSRLVYSHSQRRPLQSG